MAATYTVLIAAGLLNGPDRIEWPRCLHIGRTVLSDRHPRMWVAEITDDDAPGSLNGAQVGLELSRVDGQPVVTGRQEVTF